MEGDPVATRSLLRHIALRLRVSERSIFIPGGKRLDAGDP